MKSLFKNNQKYFIFLPIIIAIIIIGSFSLKSNAVNFQTNNTWTSTSTGSWTNTATWGLHSTLTPFLNPTGMAIDSAGYLYIADGNGGGNHRVVVLNPDGTASTTYGGTGSVLEGQIGQIGPSAVAVSKITKRIYIGDWANNRVVVLNPNGTLYNTYTNPDFNGIRALGLSPTDVLYVGSGAGNKIAVLNPDGSASTSINFVGSTIDDIDVSTLTNRIYVASADSNQIKVLNTNGSVFATYSGIPNALALGSDDTIYYTWTDTNGGNGYLNYLVTLHPDGSASSSYSLPGGVSTGMGGLAISPTGKIFTTLASGAVKILGLNKDGTTYTTYDGLALPPSFVPVQGVDYPGPNDYVTLDKGTVTLPADQTIGNLILATGGTLNLNGHTLTVASGGSYSNTGGTLVANGGKVSFSGVWVSATSGNWASSTTWGGTNSTPVEGVDYPGINDDAQILIGTVTLSQDQNVRNINLDIGGSLNLNGHTLNVSGNWSNTGGTNILNPGNEGTVKFISSSAQSISGSSVFENITKISSTVSALDFGTNSTTTITGNINLSGATGNLLSIAPTGFVTPQFIGVFAPGQISGPLAVTGDSQGNIYVLDKTTHIQKFDSNGNLLTSFGPSGSGLGQFNTNASQGSIITDSNDNIIATNWAILQFLGAIPTIEKFSSTTDPLLHFGSYGTNPGQFGSLVLGVAVDSHDNIFVSDSNNHIQKFDPSGNYISTISTYGTADGQIWAPYGLFIDSNDNIYEVDSSNNRIQKFDKNGNFIMKFGSAGSLNGQFSNLYGGISIDQAGYIYVTDPGNHRVQIFNPNGTYKAQFGTVGSGDGQFQHPQGIYIDPSNNIYIADTYINRVVKYGYLNVPQFNIIHSNPAKQENFSHLSVSGSINLSTSTFTCTSCTNGGNNINWSIPTASRRVVQQVIISSSTATSTPTATSTATTTPVVTATSTATSTPIVTATTTPPVVIKKVSRPVSTSTPVVTTNTNLGVGGTFNIGTSTIVSTTTVAPVVTTENTFTGSISTTTDVISGVTNSIKSAVLTQNQIKTVDAIVNSPVGSAITQTISTTGVVAGASAAITAVTFASPISLAEIWLIPTRIFGLLVGALGIRRKNRPWGTIYDSVTKRPIDPAYVSLIDMTTGKEVATAITDLDGRYSFSVLPGTYKIVAQKTNYLPSTRMVGKTFDEVYGDLYHGDTITIQTEGEIITKNIPMDPQGFDWNEFTKNKMNINSFIRERDITWAKISKIVFVLGFIFSLLGLIFAPKPYNLIITAFYAVAYALNYFVFKVKKAGTLVDKATNTPLSFAIVKIFKEGETTPILKKIADKFGNYYSLVPKGRYFVQIDKKNDDGGYSEVYQSAMLNIKNGVINLDVKV